MRLDLGAGQRPADGFYAVDQHALPGIDIVADLNGPLDLLPDGSVAEVYTCHTLEHVDRFLPVHNLASLADLGRALREPAARPTWPATRAPRA